MQNSTAKVVIMQWAVIAVLIIGGSIGLFMLVTKINELSDTNNTLTGNESSLRNQVKQYRAQIPSPTPTPVITVTPTTPPTVTPKP